jgi:hypothetical protein
MFKFNTFLQLNESREANEEKLTHLEHAEDHVVNAGAEGFHHAYNNLMDVHNKLLGNKNDTKVTMKYDGSPSVIFGTNPDNGKFFVASKSAFNAQPKINYTPEDIERNHGHAPGLVAKLKAALEHLPKVTPSHGIYQGDIMHTSGDVQYHNGKASFKPNTITYSAPADTKSGKQALNSKIGIAVHTAYHGPTLESMKAQYAPKLNEFTKHPDVHMISTDHDVNKVKYTPQQQAEFNQHINAASKAAGGANTETYNATAPHTAHIKQYINQTVRNGTVPNHKDFVSYLEGQRDKDVGSVKTPAAQDRKRTIHNSRITDVVRNEKHFDRLFQIHSHLQKAKDVLTNALSSHSEFGHTINGKKTKPEGFVVVRGNRPTKFVDRAEFSKANFAAKTPVAEHTLIGGGNIQINDLSDDDVTQYINSNQANADTRDDQLKGDIDDHNDMHHVSNADSPLSKLGSDKTGLSTSTKGIDNSRGRTAKQKIQNTRL